MLSQVAEHLAQGHFRVSGLEAALHRGLDSALRFGAAHPFAEEIRITTEVLDRCERDRIDPAFDRNVPGGRKRSDPMSERFDELIERSGGPASSRAVCACLARLR